MVLSMDQARQKAQLPTQKLLEESAPSGVYWKASQPWFHFTASKSWWLPDYGLLPASSLVGTEDRSISIELTS